MFLSNGENLILIFQETFKKLFGKYIYIYTDTKEFPGIAQSLTIDTSRIPSVLPDPPVVQPNPNVLSPYYYGPDGTYWTQIVLTAPYDLEALLQYFKFSMNGYEKIKIETITSNTLGVWTIVVSGISEYTALYDEPKTFDTVLESSCFLAVDTIPYSFSDPYARINSKLSGYTVTMLVKTFDDNERFRLEYFVSKFAEIIQQKNMNHITLECGTDSKQKADARLMSAPHISSYRQETDNIQSKFIQFSFLVPLQYCPCSEEFIP